MRNHTVGQQKIILMIEGTFALTEPVTLLYSTNIIIWENINGHEEPVPDNAL